MESTSLLLRKRYFIIKLNEIINVAEAERFTEISFSLDERAAKPIFISQENKDGGEFQCMLDSGASIPVWCSGERDLKETFPKADLRDNMKYILGGFGSLSSILIIKNDRKNRVD